jgi:hypothetical protein
MINRTPTQDNRISNFRLLNRASGQETVYFRLLKTASGDRKPVDFWGLSGPWPFDVPRS